MRCKWCGDIIEMGEPTPEQIKTEDECPWKKTHKAYQAYEFCWGKEKTKIYKQMRKDSGYP